MARAQEKHGFTTASYTPIIREGEGDGDDFEEADSGSGCYSGCFRLSCCCCFGWGGIQKNQESNKYLLRRYQQNGKNGDQLDYDDDESWVVKRLKKLKEVSEVVAGPKWKNLVRKVGKYFKPKKSRTQTMGYTPQSYALNFDDGGVEEDDGDLLSANFSSRFSAPLNQQKIAT